MKKLLVNATALLGGCLLGAISVSKFIEKDFSTTRKNLRKFERYYNVLNQWLILRQENNKIENYFLEKGYKKIAIYAMGELGNRLYDDLKNSNIEVKYAIDQNASRIYSDIKIVTVNDALEEVDAVVVTAITAYEEIEHILKNKLDADIISLEDVIFKL